MKRFLFSASLITLMLASGGYALAQAPTAPIAQVPTAPVAPSVPATTSSQEFNQQLDAFKAKLKAVEANAPVIPTAAAPSPATVVPSAVPTVPAVPTSPVATTPLDPETRRAIDKGYAEQKPSGSAMLTGGNEGVAQQANTIVENPLGPAANLPVQGQLPATAYALDGQAQQEQMDILAKEQQKKFEQLSFEEAMKVLLPLKPEQIREVLENFKNSREAAETPIREPMPKVEVRTISLDPSETPEVIKTSPSRVTTITMLDQTGAPWPIQDVSWAGKFEVTPPEEGGHVVRITPDTAHGMGNLSIRLVDLITPVTFTLQSGLDEVYYRFDARIPRSGPLAKTPLIEQGGLKTSVGDDQNLVQVLDGTPPASAEKLSVSGADGRTSVWRVAGQIYLRTPLTLLSPTWQSSVSSADGMNVYTLNDTPVILLSDGGRIVRASLMTEGANP